MKRFILPAFMSALILGNICSAEDAKADDDVKNVLNAVEKILRGGSVGEGDLKKLDKAVIKLESSGPEPGLRVGGDVEGGPEKGLSIQKNVYILRFDVGEREQDQLRVLKLQREILKNQLSLLKSLNAIAAHQIKLGTRTARVENTVRDMTLGMKASGQELMRVRGETASTGAKVEDISRASADMAETLEKMSRDIDDIEGAISGVDLEIRKLADVVDDGMSVVVDEMSRERE